MRQITKYAYIVIIYSSSSTYIGKSVSGFIKLFVPYESTGRRRSMQLIYSKSRKN